MAYGKLKADTLVYDNSGSDAEIAISGIPSTSAMNAKADLASPDFTTDITLKAQAPVKFEDDSGGEYVGLKAPTGVTTYTLTLPAAVGASGKVLKTSDGAGALTWGDDTALTLLDEDNFGGGAGSATAAASQQSIKAYADATYQALDADTAKTDVAQSFTASQRGKVHTISATSTLNIPLDSGQHFIIEANGAGTLTFTDLDADSVGQSGVIYFTNGAHTHSYAGHIKKASGVTIGATAGDYIIPYTVIATDKVCIDVIAVG